MTCSSALPLPCPAFFPTNPSVTQKSRPLQGRRRSHKSRLQTYAQKASQRCRSGQTCWIRTGKILKCSICFNLITVFCKFWQQKKRRSSSSSALPCLSFPLQNVARCCVYVCLRHVMYAESGAYIISHTCKKLQKVLETY